MMPIPINVCLNNGMTCHVRRKSSRRWSKLNVPVPIDSLHLAGGRDHIHFRHRGIEVLGRCFFSKVNIASP